MTLNSFLQALRRRFWLPLLFAAVAGLVMGAVILKSKPTYTATATVIAKNPENGSDRPLSFPEVATSNTVALRAIKAAHVDETVDELETSLSVVSGKSDIYQVGIRDFDPARATALANAVASESSAYYQELAAGDTASIQAKIDKDRSELGQRYLAASQALLAFDLAHPQSTVAGNASLGAQRLQLQITQQAASNAVLNFETGVTQGKVAEITTIRNFESHVLDQAAAVMTGHRSVVLVAYAAGLALLVGIATVFGLEYFAPSINRPEQAEAYLGAPVVGMIPRASRKSMRSMGVVQ
jgi:capsular polysaccharide biosynthesis protein